jgi:hypothetical protein
VTSTVADMAMRQWSGSPTCGVIRQVSDLCKKNFQRVTYLRGWSEFKGTAPNYINIFIEKKNFNKDKKHYILTFIFPQSLLAVRHLSHRFTSLNIPSR